MKMGTGAAVNARRHKTWPVAHHSVATHSRLHGTAGMAPPVLPWAGRAMRMVRMSEACASAEAVGRVVEGECVILFFLLKAMSREKEEECYVLQPGRTTQHEDI